MTPALKDTHVRDFIFLSVLFLVTRFSLLFVSTEFVSWPEELYRGTIAKEIISGLRAPLWNYQADFYDSGSLWVGSVTALFFKIFGPTFFALKLTPILLSLVLLFLTWKFLSDAFHPSAGLMGGLLFIFPPPGFLRVSMLNIGAQFESLLFLALSLILFYRILGGDQRIRWSWLLGFTQGLGAWFTALSLTGFSVFMMILVLHPRFTNKRARFALAAAAGFFVGTVPFWIYNAAHEFRGLRFLGEIFTGFSAVSWADFLPLRIFRLFALDLPRSLYFSPLFGFSPMLLQVFYAALSFIALGYSLWRGGMKKQRFKLLPLLLYILLFALIYGLTRFRVDYREQFYLARYLVPLHFVLILTAALPLSPRWVKKGLLVLGILGQMPFYLHAKPAPVFDYRGYVYTDLGAVWSEDARLWGSDFAMEPLRVRLKGYGSEMQALIAFGFFYGPNPEGAAGFAQADMKALRRLFNPRLEHFIALGYGSYAENRDAAAEIFSVSLLNNYFDSSFYRDRGSRDPEAHEWNSPWEFFYQGIRSWREGTPKPNLTLNRDEELTRWLHRGIGTARARDWIASYARSSIPADIGLTNLSISEPETKEILWGIGWGLRANFLEDSARFQWWLRLLPEKYRGEALRGALAYEAWVFNHSVQIPLEN